MDQNVDFSEFNCIPFEEKPQILLQAWFKFFAFRYAKPEDSNKLFQKLLVDLKELAEYVNSSSKDRPIFFNDDENHYVQNKEHLENSSNKIAASNSNQEKEEPPQDSDIQLLCMHNNVEDLIESTLNSKLLSINSNSQRFDKNEQEVKNVVEQPAEHGTRIEKSLQNFRIIHKSSISLDNTSQISSVHAIAPVLSTKEPEYSLSMGYEHPNTTPETESDEIIKSDSSTVDVCDNHSEILSDSNNDDDILSDEDSFKDVEYVDASLPDPEIVSLEEENVVHQEDEEIDLEDIQDVVLSEKLLSINRLIANIESLNDNPTSDCIENFAYDSEGDIRFLEALLIDDFIHSPNNESSDFNLSFPRPPLEPPDANLEQDSGEEISVVMNDSDEFKFLNPRNEFDDDDYSSFMFVIYSKMFLSFLSAKSEDTIFDPGFTPHRLKCLVFGYLSRSARSSYPFFEISLGKPISFDQYCLAFICRLYA
nr:hypothetical protein [Tanacetum cinerariifolium]